MIKLTKIDNLLNTIGYTNTELRLNILKARYYIMNTSCKRYEIYGLLIKVYTSDFQSVVNNVSVAKLLSPNLAIVYI